MILQNSIDKGFCGVLPDDRRWLSRCDVVARFPFRLLGGSIETLHDQLLSPRQPEASAHSGIMPDEFM